MRDTVWILADFLADNLTVYRYNYAGFFFLFYAKILIQDFAVPPDNYDLYRGVRLITITPNGRNSNNFTELKIRNKKKNISEIFDARWKIIVIFIIRDKFYLGESLLAFVPFNDKNFSLRAAMKIKRLRISTGILIRVITGN